MTRIETCAEIVIRFQQQTLLGDREMAEQLGVTRQTVGYWRRGEKHPSEEQIRKIVHEHQLGTWPFEMASAFADAQYAAVRAAIQAAAG